MDAKERKKLVIRIGAGVAMLVLLAFAGWWIFGPDSSTPTQTRALSPSDPMIPEKVDPAAAPAPSGTLSANPGSIVFNKDEPNTVIFTLQAIGGPVQIRSAVVPTADLDTLRVTNIDCPVAPQRPLAANESCTASVTWSGARSVNSVLTIGVGEQPAGGAAAVPAAAPVVAPVASGATGATAAPAAPTTIPAAVDGQSISIAISAVSTKPQQTAGQPVPPPQDGAQASAPQPASGMSDIQMARENYLAGRRGAPYNVATGPGGLQPAARSPYTSWDNIGIQGNKSSFPTDMSRVITPDKPLTAVTTYQIDTRSTVTAVATVDRDVYGSSGRTVVIPRGTKIIGSIGGGATDRVGIAWRQLIRPDGVRFVFDGASGDAMGRGGIPGNINNRYLERYGFSLLPTTAAAGLTVALGGQSAQSTNNGGSTQTQDARAVAAQILQQPLQQITQDIFQKKSNIPVQITVPAGTRITVWSTGDLRLKPVGEDDTAPGSTQNQQPGQGQGQGAQGQQRGFNPYAQAQGSGQSQQGQTGQAQAQAPQTGNAQNNDSSSLQVGRVDSNGRYIAPGSSAPAPSALPANNGSRVTPGQPQRTTTFPSNSNPWQ